MPNGYLLGPGMDPNSEYARYLAAMDLSQANAYANGDNTGLAPGYPGGLTSLYPPMAPPAPMVVKPGDVLGPNGTAQPGSVQDLPPGAAEQLRARRGAPGQQSYQGPSFSAMDAGGRGFVYQDPTKPTITGQPRGGGGIPVALNGNVQYFESDSPELQNMLAQGGQALNPQTGRPMQVTPFPGGGFLFDGQPFNYHTTGQYLPGQEEAMRQAGLPTGGGMGGGIGAAGGMLGGGLGQGAMPYVGQPFMGPAGGRPNYPLAGNTGNPILDSELMGAFPYDFSFGLSDLYNDPSYNFRLTEGLRGLEGSAAARGKLFSGGQLKALQRYGQDYATNEYAAAYGRKQGEFNNAYNIFENTQNKRFNRLASVAGLGQTAANQLGGASAGYGSNAGNILFNTGGAQGGFAQDRGNSRASGYVGGANAWGNALGNIGNGFQDYLTLSSIYGRQRQQKPEWFSY